MMNEYEIAMDIIEGVGIDQVNIWGNKFGIVAPVLSQWVNASSLSSRYGLPFYQTYAFFANDEYYFTYFDMGRYALPIQVDAYGQSMRIQPEEQDKFITERVKTFIADNRSFEFRQHIACIKTMAEIFGYDPSEYVPFTLESIKAERV